MKPRIITCSIKSQDTENLELMDDIEEYARSKGITRSWLILKALKEYNAVHIKGNNAK